MKKKLLALFLSCVMVFSLVPVALTSAFATGSSFQIYSSNGTVAETVLLQMSEKMDLTAVAETGSGNYQWQIRVSGDVWANIVGTNGNTLELSYGLVANALDNDTAEIRCKLTNDVGDVSYSNIVTVQIQPDSTVRREPDASPAAGTVLSKAQPIGKPVFVPADTPAYYSAPVANDAPTTYTILINYIFEDGTPAADPYTASIAAGSNFSATVTFPTVQGYLPYVGEANESTTSMELNYTEIGKDYTYNVVYKPTNVDYTVIHYQQNLNDDNYTQKERETKQGQTNSTVPDVAKTYEGFYALLYEKPTIAADGSTLVEVNYDRYYYLMNFNLDGGYGVEPIYARFGAPISVDESALEKPGYTFGGWNETIPATMPAQNTTYTAKWNECGDTAFTVAFYYENADDNGYTFMGSNVHKGTTGDPVNGSDYKGENFSGKDADHFTYNADKTDKNVEIKGDGSTVVKVYFSRNVYTMNFYGATCGRVDWPIHLHSRDRCCKGEPQSITAKYNANIAEKYAEITQNHRWCRWDTSTCTALVSYMPDNSDPNALKYWQNKDGDTVYNITYAYESENGTRTHDGKKFTALATSHVPMSFVGYDADYLPAVRNGYSVYTDYSKAASPEFKDGQIRTKDVTLFYYANTYKLRFMNAENELKTANVKYNFSIKSNSGFTPDASLAPNGMVFDCWCLDSAGAQPVDWNAQKMPAGDLVLYARWKPVNHTVEFYLDHAALNAGTKLSTHPDITVRHGSKADPTPAAPTNGGYTFIGWFYMENGVEKAFDFANMPVTKDLQVYGKWSSNTLKEYTIYYKIQGTDTEIAAPTTGSALAGVTKTFEAKGGTDLYADYQEGYFPVTKSHSLTLDINATAENDTNVYTFWYVQKEAVPYTVKYLNKTTGESVATEKTVSDNRKAVVTENFVPVSGMMPDAYQKRLVVSVDKDGNPDTEHNVIIFYYTEDTTHAYYKITHYTENLAKDAQGNTTWTEYASSQAVGDIGTTYNANPMTTIPGFTYDSTVPGTVTSGELTANGLELKLYYTRNSYPYQVRYLEQGTGKQLADPKDGTGKYGQVISESAIDIEHYDAVGPTSQTLNIRIEEGTEAKLNIITFYYTEKEVTINYLVVGPNNGCGTVSPISETLKVLSGTTQGSTPTANENFRFVGWYTDEACTTPVATEWVDINNKLTPVKAANAAWTAATYYAKFEYDVADLTITKQGCENIDENQCFLFDVTGPDGYQKRVVINGNGSVTIKGLKIGTYTITEVTNWSWRYTAKSNSQNIELKPVMSNTVNFTNTRSIYKWLGGDAYSKNIFGN